MFGRRNGLLVLAPLLMLVVLQAFADEPELELITGDRFVLDLRYNTANNFLKTDVYGKFGLDKCYVRPELAAKLRRLSGLLAERRLKLIIYDCYRPLDVQREMWKIVSDPKFVADPKKGSKHNRGVAIDAALAGVDGKALAFPTEFDDFTMRADHSFICNSASPEPCANRDLLKKIMIKAGLTPLSSEWWHYELPDAKKYPLIERFQAKPN
jgi:D-alanyl-D-alanine dipeptidase